MLTETIPRFAPEFNLESERSMRRAAIVEADRALSEAVEAVKSFQGQHYATGADGRLILRVSKPGDVVCADATHFELHKLKVILSEAHDQFQLALGRYSEIAP